MFQLHVDRKHERKHERIRGIPTLVYIHPLHPSIVAVAGLYCQKVSLEVGHNNNASSLGEHSLGARIIPFASVVVL
jgi:hypothetical protein